MGKVNTPSANGNGTAVPSKGTPQVDDDPFGKSEYAADTEAEDAEDEGDPIPAVKAKRPADPDPVEKPIHSKRLLKRAKDAGFSDEEVAAFESSEDLDEGVYVREREIVAELRGEVKTKPGKGVTDKVEEDKIDWGAFEIEGDDGKKRVIAEEDIAAPIVHVVKGMAKKIKELEGKLKVRDERDIAAVEATQEQQLDTAFNKYPQLGKGSAKDVANTPFMRRRMAVFVQLRTMPQEVQRKLTIEQAVAKVMKDLYDAEAEEADAAEIKPAPAAKKPKPADDLKDKFKAGRLAKPTGRKATDLPRGKEKAKAALAEWWDENMANEDDEDDDSSEY